MPRTHAGDPSGANKAPQFAVLQLARGIGVSVNIGVVVVDNKNDELYIRMRDNWSGFSDDEVEILGDLASDLQAKAVELGPLPLLAYLEDCLSNAILITERQTLSSDIEIDEELVNSLFSREVMRL